MKEEDNKGVTAILSNGIRHSLFFRGGTMRALIYLIILVSFLDTFVQLPIIGPYAKSLGAGSLGIGLTIGMYSLSNMAGNVFAGHWIDRFGAKVVLVTGMVITAAVLLLYLTVHTPEQLIAVRFVHGLTGGLLTPCAFTIAASRASMNRQGRAMALSGASVGMAAIIGPAMGGIFKAKWGVDSVFIVTSILLALFSLVAWAALPRQPKRDSSRSRERLTWSEAIPEWTRLLRNPYAVTAYTGAFALLFAMGVLTFALPLKTDELLMPAQTAGMLLSTFGLIAILVFVLPSNRMFDRLPPFRLLLIGLAIVMVSLLGLSSLTNLSALYVVMGIYGIGYALIFPSASALLVRHVPKEDRGKAFGLFYAFFSLGVVAGSSAVGALTSDPDTALVIAAGGLVLLTLSLLLRNKRMASNVVKDSDA